MKTNTIKIIAVGLLTFAGACLTVPTFAQTSILEERLEIEARAAERADAQRYDFPASQRKVDFSGERFATLHLAQGTTRNDAQRSSVVANEQATDMDRPPSQRGLEEVIVTAQKRQERLIDVPQSVTVLSSDALVKLGATQLRDFANTVPGLTFTPSGAGVTKLSLRGVTALSPGASVGVYVDEVPYGSSSSFGYPNESALDVALFDTDRVEVLRGPQGTLYGSSTMGGLLKYVTRQPDTSGFSFDSRAGLSSTHHGGINYDGSATINAPVVNDKAAIRASGFYSHDAGYVDNVALGKKDVDQAAIYGGRADLLITPFTAFSIRITGFLQDVHRDGAPVVSFTSAGIPTISSLEQSHPLGDSLDQRFRLVSGTVVYDFDTVSLTSISSYQTARTEAVFENSALAGLCPIVGLSCSAAGLFHRPETTKFVQEIRLSSEGGRPLEWIIGGFFTDETSDREAGFILRDPAGRPTPGSVLGSLIVASDYQEYAGFGDLTWHLNSKFNVTGGLRYAHNSQTFAQVGTGFLGSTPPRDSSEHVFTYLLNARYQFRDNATGYVRYATGYRPGGPNYVTVNPSTGAPLAPPTFSADRLKSYEAGFKAESESGRFGIDLATYYIDWNRMQILTTRNGLSVQTNADSAVSSWGSELALTAHPSPSLTVTGAFAYQNATLSDADVDLGAKKDERLPTVPHFTAALNADYELPVGADTSIGITVRHVSDRTADFSGRSAKFYTMPAYTTVDLRAGFSMGMVDTQFYVRNLLDKRAELASDFPEITIQQPRTVGVLLSTHF